MHCDWVLQDLSSQGVLSELRVCLGAMREDGREVPTRGWTPDQEALAEVGVKAAGVLLGLVVR